MFKKILIGIVATLGIVSAANAGDVKFRIVIGSDRYYHDEYEPRCWTTSHYEYRHGRRVMVEVTECEQISYERGEYRRHRHHRRHW